MNEYSYSSDLIKHLGDLISPTIWPIDSPWLMSICSLDMVKTIYFTYYWNCKLVCCDSLVTTQKVIRTRHHTCVSDEVTYTKCPTWRPEMCFDSAQLRHVRVTFLMPQGITPDSIWSTPHAISCWKLKQMKKFNVTGTSHNAWWGGDLQQISHLSALAPPVVHLHMSSKISHDDCQAMMCRSTLTMLTSLLSHLSHLKHRTFKGDQKANCVTVRFVANSSKKHLARQIIRVFVKQCQNFGVTEICNFQFPHPYF